MNDLDLQTNPPTTRSRSTGWIAASLAIPTLMSSLDTSIANVALPTLAHAFSATFPQVQWVVLAYLLALTTLVVGAGRLGDLQGRRRMLLAGIALFTLASVACGLATSLTALVVARAAQGLGASLMMALSLAFVADVIPAQATGRTMGMLGTMSAIGTALGPSLGGALLASLGWRSAFLVNLPIGVVSAWLAYRQLPADAPRRAVNAGHFDVAGVLLMAATLFAWSLAMTSGHAALGVPTGALLAAVAVGGAAFLVVESRAASPLVRLGVLRAQGLGVGLLQNTLVSAVVMSTLVVGPFYLARGLGLPTAVVGLVLSIGPLVVAFTGVPAGRAVDRLGASVTCRSGLALMAAGALALALLPTATGVAGYVLPIALLTAGYAFFQTANNTAVMATRPADERGVVSGLLGLSRNLGLITGASALGAVFATASGSSRAAVVQPDAIALGMRVTYGCAAALVLLALALTVARRALASSAIRTAAR